MVDGFLYPRMQRFIYGTSKPYITSDERKLTEIDIRRIREVLGVIEMDTYFNFLVNRIVPDRYDMLARIDRLLLVLLRPIAPLLAGRVLFSGRVVK